MGRLYYWFSTIQKNQSVHITQLLAGVWHISAQIVVLKCIAKLHKQTNCNHCTPPLNRAQVEKKCLTPISMALFMSEQPNLEYLKMKMTPCALFSHQKLISMTKALVEAT